MKNLKFILLPLFILIFLACEKDKSLNPEENVYSFIDETMHSYYLWYDEVSDIDYNTYSSPTELLDDLKVEKDRWSFIDKTETVLALFEEGEYFGFGFYIRFDENGDLRIPIVFNSSTAYKQGIRKGDEIISINGSTPQRFTEFDSFFDDEASTMTFRIESSTIGFKTYTLSKETVIQNAVFHSDIIESTGKKIGYIVYDSFLGYSADKLREAFAEFHRQNIDELIVDLRYNGGGYISLAEEMAEMIAPFSCVGKALYSNLHNKLIGAVNDTTVYFKTNELNLNLERVFFITSGNSASASELVINSLSPYMDVKTIGARTHGKPVGMHGFEYEDWVFFPVVNYVANSEGFYDYLNGLDVDKETNEGLDKAWGDISDPALSQALYFIDTGSFLWLESASQKSTKKQLQFSLGAKRNLLLFDR